MLHRTLAILAIVTILVRADVAVAVEMINVIAVSGATAPGTVPPAQFAAGTSFPPIFIDTPFSSLSIANNGLVAFAAELDRQFPWANNGLWAKSANAPLRLIAREGDPVPGFQGVLEHGFGGSPLESPKATNNGVAFTAWIDGFSAAVFLDNGPTNALMAAIGQPAPGTNSRFTRRITGAASPNGNILIRAAFEQEVILERQGLWLDEGSGLQKIALQSEIAPGVQLPYKSFGPMVVNDAGEVAFVAQYDVSAENSGDEQFGIWASVGGNLRLVKDLGSPAVVKPILLNNRGDVVFRDDFGSTFIAIASNSHQIKQVLGPTLDQLGGLSDTGSVSFGSSTATATADENGNVNIIARSGDSVPGLAPEYEFGVFFHPPLINSQGWTAFAAEFIGPDGGIAGTGVWVKTDQGPLRQIVYTGQSVDVAAGNITDLRTIAGIAYPGAVDDPPIAFNDSGQLACLVGFSDGSAAVIVVDVLPIPEPDLWVILCCGMIGATFLARPNRANSQP